LEKTIRQNNKKNHRVVIFTNGTWGVPAVLTRGTLAALSHFPDVKVVAVCLPEKQSPFRIFISDFLYTIVASLRSFLDKTPERKHRSLQPLNIRRCAGKYHFKVLIPPKGDMNDPVFIAHLRDTIQPTIALSFYCLQTFRAELLGIFDDAINYHNGLLPAYRGLNATSWSLYQGEKFSGFTFHRMTEELDAGNILIQNMLPVEQGVHIMDLEMDKAASAVNYLPDVLQMAMDKHPGRPQTGTTGYHSRKDSMSLTTIPDPSSLSKAEIIKRLNAFEKLNIHLSGRWYEVTGIREIHGNFSQNSRFVFSTADGVTMKAVHFLYLPFALYRLYRWWNRFVQRGKCFRPQI